MQIPSGRNPNLTSSINPHLTASLNPNLTSSLNPNLTSSINPRLTSSLNPRLTSRINPKLTGSINYKLTSSKNPSLTSSINPKLTSSINPNLSANIPGLYLFDTKLQPVGFTVEQSTDFWIIYGPDCSFSGIAIKVRNGFFNIHDRDNDFIGFFLNARGRVWLRFNDANKWEGVTT